MASSPRSPLRDPLSLDRLSLRFTDPGEEAVFAAERARELLRPLRIFLVCATAFVVLLAAMNKLALPNMLEGFDFAQTAGYLIVAFGLCYGTTYTQTFLRWQQQYLVAWITAMSAAVVLVIAQLPADVVVTRGYAPMILHLFTIYGLFGLRFSGASVAGWTSAALYLVVMGAGGLLDGHDFTRHAAVLFLSNIWGMLVVYQIDSATRRQHVAMRRLGEERARSERLLLNVLPAAIAERLKASESAIADHCGAVTVLFADIAGFTALASRLEPHALVDLLNRIFSAFDALAERHGLEKIKTIGDAYMAVAGVPEPRADHAYAAARMAQDMVAAVGRIAAEQGEPLNVRIGLHSGPVVAGVIGRRKFSYDLWGDTVNVASRLESAGQPGRVNVSSETQRLIGERIACEFRGSLEAKGKGRIEMYFIASGPDAGGGPGDAMPAGTASPAAG